VILPVFWAAAGFRRLSAVAHGLPSGLAVAPKVASAPRGQRQGPLAGNPAQSLPRAARIHFQGQEQKKSTQILEFQHLKLYLKWKRC
jgi:hypothetical protein